MLPGMQSAFVDLGLERDTFLYVSDFFEEHPDIDTVSDDKPAAGNVAVGAASRERTVASVQERRSRRLAGANRSCETRRLMCDSCSRRAAAAGSPAPSSRRRDDGIDSATAGAADRARGARAAVVSRNKVRAAVASIGSENAAELRQPESCRRMAGESEADVLILPGESLAKIPNVRPSRRRPTAESEARSTPKTERR